MNVNLKKYITNIQAIKPIAFRLPPYGGGRGERPLFAFLFSLLSLSASAQTFDTYFEDATLRLDYIFAGNDHEQHIFLEDVKQQEKWAGRRNRLDEKFLNGNGQITVMDHDSKEVIYVWTFSTLFQEWQLEAEAKTTDRAFETSYNIPFPKNKVDVTVTLTDNHNVVTSKLTHTIDPKDILIRRVGENGVPFRYMWKGNNAKDDVNVIDCIDVAILAEGYTEAEMGKFYADCERAVEALFAREPFKSMKDRFNVVAVAAPSLQSGPSVPLRNKWTNTATGSHYSTFYSDRYLTTRNIHKVYDLLSGVPFEHIIVLANTDIYGGGGIYNQVTVVTSDHPTFNEVLVHEFGHSFGGLGDEYEYGNTADVYYPADTEPWEPNLTTLVDFKSKWEDMMPKNQPVPTPKNPKVPDYRSIDFNDAKAVEALNAATQVVGVFEGGGYQEKGCYRPAQECRMKINEVRDFCPVCARAIRRITDFYTGKSEK